MNILKSYRLIRPKKVKYPIPEIPDDSEKKIGYGLGIAKKFRVGSGIGYRAVDTLRRQDEKRRAGA